jgi:hypothetical protein
VFVGTAETESLLCYTCMAGARRLDRQVLT